MAWILTDGQELAVAVVEGGGPSLLLFTDEDLATTYAQHPKAAGKTPQLLGPRNLLSLLLEVRSLGVTHVALDATAGKYVNRATIDEVISSVTKQIG